MAVLLTLESKRWRLEIAGPLRNLPAFLPAPISVMKLEGSAELQVASRDSGELTPASADCQTAPLFFENAAYDCYLTSQSGEASLDLPPGVSLRHRTGTFTHHALSFGNDVGWAELTVRDGGETVRLRFEVFPLKIDYRTDYASLRDEVAAMARGLAMTVQARTFGAAGPSPSAEPTLAEWIALLKGYFEQFARTANTVIANPHSTLKTAPHPVDAARARRVGERALERRLRRPLSRSGGISASGVLLPMHVPEVRRRTTFDNPENRYFKYLLLETLRKLQQVAAAHDTGDEDADLSAEQRFFEALRPEASAMIRRIQGLLHAPFLQDLQAQLPGSFFSPVLYRHPSYSAFVQAARLLNSGLSLQGGALQIGIKNIAQLYEYWCFLRLVRLFKESFPLEQQSLVQLRHLRLVIVLAKGKEAAVTFRETASGKRLCLLYDRMFKGLPTVSQRPDNVIQLASEERLYILDAKYRLAFDADYTSQYGGVGPTVDDINTMHRYRDAIVIPHPLKPGEFQRGIVQGAAVLFPFRDESAYQNQRFFKSIAEVQIGGLPFLPGTATLAENHIRGILRADGYLALAN
jgi:predicted component of viral defense system (DUF524 family)